MNFKELNCEVTNINTSFQFKGQTINIVSYLSARDKYDLLNLTIEKSFDRNCYNPFLLDAYFHLHLIYLYTDLVFDEEDRADELVLFDKLNNSGLLDKVLENIDKDEYEDLLEYLNSLVECKEKDIYSISAVLDKLIKMGPETNENWAELMENFDVDKMSQLGDIMKYLGGGKPLEMDNKDKEA